MNLGTRKSARPVARRSHESRRLRTLAVEALEQRRLLAGPQLENLDPAANSHIAPLDTNISAVFDQDIAPASVSDATLAVYAMQTGKLLEPGSEYSVDGNTITLNPAADFKPGEVVQATVNAFIRNPAGERSSAPYVWQLRTAVTGGNGIFSRNGQTLGDSPS